MALGSMDILKMLVLLYEHRISFYSFVSFLSSVSLSCLCTDLLTPWLNLFLSILLVLMLFQTDFLSFPDSLLLIYTNTTEFYMLTLQSATLLNLFTTLFNFLVKFLGFSIYDVICNQRSF